MLVNVFAVLSIGFMGRALGEGTFNPSATATSSAPGATHTVSVGADGFNFSPNQVFASIGDIIEYRFYPQNHSVARAAFGSNPCIPYELTGPGRVGFWSGFEPVALVLNNPPIFRVPVNDTDPVFFYCSAPGACLEGMVGVINPNSTFSYQAQFNYTQNATVQFSPGEYFPKEEGPTSRTTTATGATATPTVQTASTTGPAATTTAAAPVTEHSHSSGLPTGAIVGIAIGGFAVVVLAGALIYMCGRQKTVKEMLRHSQPPQAQQAYPASPGMSEAQYSNMQKTPMIGTHYSGQSYGGPPTDHESYRTASPPPAGEHQPMMGGMHPMHLNLHNHSGPPSAAGSPGFPSPTYSQEMEHAAAVRPYNPEDHPSNHLNPTVNQTQNQDNGPHEMPVPSRNASTAVGPPTPQNPDNRPFSYTDSESGYAKVATPIEKSGTLR